MHDHQGGPSAAPQPPATGPDTMPLIFQDRITSDDLRDHPDRLYLFGDNEQRQGHGGQAAACRGHANAVGIATKRAPERTDNAYWADADYDRIITIIDHDLAPAFVHVRKGGDRRLPDRRSRDRPRRTAVPGAARLCLYPPVRHQVETAWHPRRQLCHPAHTQHARHPRTIATERAILRQTLPLGKPVHHRPRRNT